MRLGEHPADGQAGVAGREGALVWRCGEVARISRIMASGSGGPSSATVNENAPVTSTRASMEIGEWFPVKAELQRQDFWLK